MEQNNLSLISTIATLLICFFVVMFGISRILNLANPSAPEKVRYAVARAENSNTSKAINQLLQSPEKITSAMINFRRCSSWLPEWDDF